MPFLVFEGIDASGKSTLLNLLCKKFQKDQISFVRTREPGGTAIGQKIRHLLLEKETTSLDPIAESLLYYADRKQHIEELIQPSLQKGLWVLSDRYWASTAAYQCGGRGIDESFITQLQKSICTNCKPDLWILLDLDVKITMKRLLDTKKDKRDRFELEKKNFHQRVRDYYLKLSSISASKWLVLDATQNSEKLLQKIISHLKEKKLLR